MSLPHARGGVSLGLAGCQHTLQSSPRPWGCFESALRAVAGDDVFPTPVGVFLPEVLCLTRQGRLPHARGGVSMVITQRRLTNESSPRPWGCFHMAAAQALEHWVFPTPVGVFPRSCRGCLCHGGLPHARGGVSARATSCSKASWSSPRPWGCFHGCPDQPEPAGVFPTPVGVFLDTSPRPRSSSSLPHARGGVSKTEASYAQHLGSSPRPWGCFLM